MFIDLIVVVVVVCCCDLLLLLWLMLLLWLTFVKVQKVLHIKKGFYLCVFCVFVSCCFLFRLARTSRLTQSTTTDKVLFKAF